MPSLRINSLRDALTFDLSGRRYGGFVVRPFNVDLPGKGVVWLCECDCGSQLYLSRLEILRKQNCGCQRLETDYSLFVLYGFPGVLRIMTIYTAMKRRCHNRKDANFKSYGARGIRVCKEWLNDKDAFIWWALTHGYSDGLTLDRQDNYSGYSDWNCRWITSEEQLQNMRVHQDRTETMVGLLSCAG